MQKKIKKFITLWGNGRARRELMHADDLADACIFFLQKKTKEKIINIGSNFDMTILNYAKLILKEINFDCKIILDKTKPTGTFRKLLDTSIAKNMVGNQNFNKTGFKKILDNQDIRSNR